MEKIINIFGDSITRGACDRELGGWADRLKQYLAKEEDENNYFEVFNLGIGGDNSDELLKRFANENGARDPNVIIIAIGINDSQYFNTRDNPRVPLERFESNILEIIKQAKKFTEKIIFVGLTKVDESNMMPTPWHADKYYDNKNVSIYNNKIKEICDKNKLLFVEMMDILNDDDLEDGLHPNSRGHEKMFLRIKDFLLDNKIV